MCHTLTRQACAPDRHKHFQAFDHKLPCLRLPASIEPQNAKCQRRINGSLRLLSIHAQQRKCRLPMPQKPARIDGTKRVFQIDGSSELG
jgi:hypothetical protein